MLVLFLCYCPQKNFLGDGFTNLQLSYIVEKLTGVQEYGSSFVSSHGCAKDEIINKPIEKLFTHYPQWVRSKQFRQEVTFCMVEMVISSVYRKFPSKRLFISWIYNRLSDKFCDENICFLSVTRMHLFCLHVFLLQHCSRLVSSRWTKSTSNLASLRGRWPVIDVFFCFFSVYCG